MIRVTIELLPGGREKGKKLLGEMTICNDGETSDYTDGKRGSYTTCITKWNGGVWKRGRVDDFDRVKRGPWDLLYLALRNLVGKRNP